MAYRTPEAQRITEVNAKKWAYISKSIIQLATEALNDNDGYFFLPPIDKKEGAKFLCRSTKTVDGWRLVGLNIPAYGGCPTWEEQVWIKSFFFDKDDVVMMFHGKQKYIGNNTYWLHFWYPENVDPKVYRTLLPQDIYMFGQVPFRKANFITRLWRGIKSGLKETFTLKTENAN